jgi:drug/metabolite transporter (DMT)-like permease
MIFLFVSILTTSAIYLLFKFFDRWGVRLFETIVVNYITAVTIGLLMVPDLSGAIASASSLPKWTLGGLGMGAIFISVFYTVALSSARVGISVTTIASKMSLALAVLLFVAVDPNEHLGLGKGIALLLAISGVVFSSLREDETGFHWKFLMYPLAILLGSTFVDFGVAYFSSMPQNESELALYSCLSFATAACIGVTIVLWHMLRGKYHIRWKEIAAGFALGLVNYSSIYSLVLAYESNILPKSSLLPVCNLAVVLVTALIAVFFMKEKLNAKNWIGLALSVLAILLLVFN